MRWAIQRKDEEAMQSGEYPCVSDVVWGGKLPSHGDFLWGASRGAARSRLEEWMQLGMLQGRSHFGSAWHACLTSAPVWNFLLPASACGDGNVVAGCLAPSCDRVGRCYPFVVGYVMAPSQLQTSPSLVNEIPLLLHLTGQQLYAAIRRAWPRAALDGLWKNVLSQWWGGWSVDSVRGFDLGAGSDILEVLGASPGASPGEAELVTRPASRETAFPWPDVAHSLRQPNGPSFWWTHSAGGAALRALAYDAVLDASLMIWLFGRSYRAGAHG